MAKVYRYVLSVVMLLLCPAAYPQQKPNTLTVDESKISFHLLPETRLDFPLLNTSDHPLHGTLLLELLDAFNTSTNNGTRQERSFQAAPGAHMEKVEWNSQELPSPSPMFLGSYRLRYTVTPSKEGGFEPIQGIIQLGPHIEDGFDLQVFPSGQFHCSPDCRFRARVAEPRTGQPWAGVEVEASLSVGNDGKTVLKDHGLTNREGYASFHFNLPASQR